MPSTVMDTIWIAPSPGMSLVRTLPDVSPPTTVKSVSRSASKSETRIGVPDPSRSTSWSRAVWILSPTPIVVTLMSPVAMKLAHAAAVARRRVGRYAAGGLNLLVRDAVTDEEDLIVRGPERHPIAHRLLDSRREIGVVADPGRPYSPRLEGFMPSTAAAKLAKSVNVPAFAAVEEKIMMLMMAAPAAKISLSGGANCVELLIEFVVVDTAAEIEHEGGIEHLPTFRNRMVKDRIREEVDIVHRKVREVVVVVSAIRVDQRVGGDRRRAVACEDATWTYSEE